MTTDPFDTEAWREERNEKLLGWMAGDRHAVQFVLDLSMLVETWDDLIDKDKPIEDSWIVAMMYKLLIDMHVNPFFTRYKVELVPIMSVAINAWLDANTMEHGTDTAKSRAYVLRDLTIEILLHSIMLMRGRDYMRSVSLSVREFFLHESLDEYKESMQ